MLITSRRSSPEARHLGAYEVVFGLQAASAANTRPMLHPPSADFSSELQHLRAQLQEIKSSLQGARPAIPRHLTRKNCSLSWFLSIWRVPLRGTSWNLRLVARSIRANIERCPLSHWSPMPPRSSPETSNRRESTDGNAGAQA